MSRKAACGVCGQCAVATDGAAAGDDTQRGCIWIGGAHAGHPGDGAAAAQLALGHALMLWTADIWRRRRRLSAARRQAMCWMITRCIWERRRLLRRIGQQMRFRRWRILRRSIRTVCLRECAGDAGAGVSRANHDAAARCVRRSRWRIPEGKPCGLSVGAGEGVPGEWNFADAAKLYRGILSERSAERAGELRGKNQLAVMQIPLTVAERKQHADAMSVAHQHGDAAIEYRGHWKMRTSTQAGTTALGHYSMAVRDRAKC